MGAHRKKRMAANEPKKFPRHISSPMAKDSDDASEDAIMIPEDAVLLRFLFVRSCAAFKVLLPTTLEAGQSPSSILSFGKSQPPLLQSP